MRLSINFRATTLGILGAFLLAGNQLLILSDPTLRQQR